MRITAKRKQLHEFIDTADEKEVEAMFTLVEGDVLGQPQITGSLLKMSKMNFMKQASSDPLFLEDMNDVSKDFDFIDNEKI